MRTLAIQHTYLSPKYIIGPKMNKWDMAKLIHYYCVLKLIVNKTCGLMTEIEHDKKKT